MAIPGAEFFAHPYELGVRKAKEWLFTADWISAQDAQKTGMVNHVVPRAELEAFTLRMAERIADKDRFTLKLIKESMNACQDAMGRREGMKAAFNLHQIGHMQNLLVHGFPIDSSKLSPALRERFKTVLAKAGAKDSAEK
jgi:enoyl-CoA hydratase